MFDKTKKESDKPSAPKAAAPAPSSSSKPAPASNSGQTTTIGSSIKLNGELNGDEDLLIQGQVEGNIYLKEYNLTIGEQGVIKANAFARTITVRGQLTGDLNGVEKVTITSTGKVRGNIVSPKVILEEGASFKGSIDMDAKAAKPASQPAASAKTA
ncbi:bactofilin family protein [Thiolapillus sp.]